MITAASGVEALEIVNGANVNLVLSDLMMPGMSGTELTKSVKSMRPTMPVILISGVNEIPSDASYADRFISKVGGPELLFETVIEVLTELRAYQLSHNEYDPVLLRRSPSARALSYTPMTLRPREGKTRCLSTGTYSRWLS